MVNVTELYPNSPTPDLDQSNWDFDPGYNLLMGEYQSSVFMYLNLILNPASILCGSAVCFILLCIRAYDKSLVDRVSLRLTAVVSAVDVIKAAVYIIFTYVATPGATCSATAWLVLFLTNLYTFLSVAIAFNLQWIFLQGNRIHKNMEIGYFCVSLALALATTIPPLAASRLGLDPNYGSCWFKSYSSKRTIAWEWATFLSWNLIGSVYCFLIVVAVIIRLRQNVITLGAFGSPDPTTQKRTRRTQMLLRKLVLRVSLYALIPLVTQGGWYVSEIIMQFEHRLDPGVTYWVISGTDLPGVLNLIAFCMDPALANALKRIKLDMIERYGDVTSPNHQDHKFARWITRVLLGTKKIDTADSPFYRMSATDNLDSNETASYTEIDSRPFTSSTMQPSRYPPNLTSDHASSRTSCAPNTAINDNTHEYQMYWMSDANETQKTRRRKRNQDEKIRNVFRGL